MMRSISYIVLLNFIIVFLLMVNVMLNCHLSWLTITIASVLLSGVIRITLCSVGKRLLIEIIKNMTFKEFFHLYKLRIMDTPHRIYDHAQVFLSLAKWADAKTENQNRFFDRTVALMKLPEGNSSLMDIIVAVTYLLACNKHPTMEEVSLVIGNFTQHHNCSYSIYMELINNFTDLCTVISVNDTGKDWHLDDAVSLFILFDVLMLANAPNLQLYIIGAGRDPDAATHNHKILATGILGDAIKQVYFMSSTGAANEAVTGVQHVIKFVMDGDFPQTYGRGILLKLQQADIVAFCAETSCVSDIAHIKAIAGGIQGGFEKSTGGDYVGFNAVQSHNATSILEQWTISNVEHVVNATKTYAYNLSQRGTDIFNDLLKVIGVNAVDMQLSSLLKIDPIRYAGIRDTIPDFLKGVRLYDRMTPFLVQLGVLHNPHMWVTFIPTMRDQLTDPSNISMSCAHYGKTTKRKLFLWFYITIVKVSLYL